MRAWIGLSDLGEVRWLFQKQRAFKDQNEYSGLGQFGRDSGIPTFAFSPCPLFELHRNLSTCVSFPVKETLAKEKFWLPCPLHPFIIHSEIHC
jgi:hypothetical protein